MVESFQDGKKTLWEKEKLLLTSNFSFSHSVFKRVTSNFSFSHSVFKRPVLQTRTNQGLFGKGLSTETWRNACLDDKNLRLITRMYMVYSTAFNMIIVLQRLSVKAVHAFLEFLHQFFAKYSSKMSGCISIKQSSKQ